MSAQVEEIWNTPTASPQPEAVVAEAPAVDAPKTETPSEPVAKAEQPESPSSAEATSKDAAKPAASEAAADNFDPESYVDPKTKQQLPADIKGRLAKTAEYQREAKAFETVKPVLKQLDDFGGLPALQETVELRSALEAEDFPAFFKSLEGISESKATAVKTAMIEAALATEEWQEIAVERATGKTTAELKALIAASTPAEAESEYDAEGNFLTPEARRIAALEKEIADIKAGDAAKKQTAEQLAAAEKAKADRLAVETSTMEFIGETWKPVEAKARLANLYPTDSDSPELKAIKEEIVSSLENDLAKEFFEGPTTKKFASLTLDYLARGERETAFKRLEAAQKAAEALADKYIARGSKRIADYLELQALKLQPTTRKESLPSTAAPGNHSGITAPVNQTIDDIWAVNPEKTRDALAGAR